MCHIYHDLGSGFRDLNKNRGTSRFVDKKTAHCEVDVEYVILFHGIHTEDDDTHESLWVFLSSHSSSETQKPTYYVKMNHITKGLKLPPVSVPTVFRRTRDPSPKNVVHPTRLLEILRLIHPCYSERVP